MPDATVTLDINREKNHYQNRENNNKKTESKSVYCL